jgi:hypothetical protein
MRTARFEIDKSLSDSNGTFGLYMSDSGLKTMMTTRPEGAAVHPGAPIGTWLVNLVQSPEWYNRGSDFGMGRGMVYELQNVTGRSHIQIHPGNWPEPIKTATEAEHYQTLGCLLPGAQVANIEVPAPDGRTLRGVTSSVAAVKALYADMEGEPFMLTILLK